MVATIKIELPLIHTQVKAAAAVKRFSIAFIGGGAGNATKC